MIIPQWICCYFSFMPFLEFKDVRRAFVEWVVIIRLAKLARLPFFYFYIIEIWITPVVADNIWFFEGVFRQSISRNNGKDDLLVIVASKLYNNCSLHTCGNWEFSFFSPQELYRENRFLMIEYLPHVLKDFGCWNS